MKSHVWIQILARRFEHSCHTRSIHSLTSKQNRNGKTWLRTFAAEVLFSFPSPLQCSEYPWLIGPVWVSAYLSMLFAFLVKIEGGMILSLIWTYMMMFCWLPVSRGSELSTMTSPWPWTKILAVILSFFVWFNCNMEIWHIVFKCYGSLGSSWTLSMGLFKVSYTSSTSHSCMQLRFAHIFLWAVLK